MTIEKAACIGGGVIGAGWVARLVLNGIDVAIFDPDPEAKRKVGEVMKGARRAYKRMAGNGLPREGRITYAKSIAEAVEDAALIQESVPERLDLKHGVLVSTSLAFEARKQGLDICVVVGPPEEAFIRSIAGYLETLK